jgi:hypothetical protein
MGGQASVQGVDLRRAGRSASCGEKFGLLKIGELGERYRQHWAKNEKRKEIA